MDPNWSDNECFEVIAPEQWILPIVLNSPHSGTIIPASLRQASNLSPSELRRSEDRFVDELFCGCVASGVPLLKARISRAYIDLNREPYELDPTMFEDQLPLHANTTSPRVIAGLGTIPRMVGDGHTIYSRKLKYADALQRTENVYRPYHRALSSLVATAYDRLGFVCLIDCHSMPPTATIGGSSNCRSPDVVLGDRHGAACSNEITQSLKDAFEAVGLRVRLNHPYPGGFITETYGLPRAGRHAIQIELNRALYLTSNGLERNKNFNKLKEKIEIVFDEFATAICALAESLGYQRRAAE